MAADLAEASMSFGGSEIIVISGVQVGSPVMTTYSQCTGYVDHNNPVVPVTVKASFITAPGVEPTGPYGGVQAWDGGLAGAPDDHFRTGQAHSPVQFFHSLAYASPWAFHGAGSYTFTVFAQDVGTAPALTELDTTKSIPGPPPSGGGAKVKCSIAKPYTLGEIVGDGVKTALKKIGEEACGVCFTVKDAIDQVSYYSDLLDDAMGKAAIDDPPDSDYQEIAQPQAPPLLPPPDGLDATQQSALVNLEQALADDIGLARALLVSEDRVWGADNAASRYWYLKQLRAEGRYAGQLADALGQLPPLYTDLQAAFMPGLPAFSLGYADVHNWLVDYSDGITGGPATTLGQLGASSDDLQQLVADAISVDAADVVTTDGVSALFAQNHDDFAPAMRAIAQWAAEAQQAQPPVISDVTPHKVDALGGTAVTVTGVNLGDVSAIQFGPSTPYTGEGRGTSCTDTQCTTYAPPGSGTVDVVAIGPGGPSAAVPEDKVTYTVPPTPQVTSIFPTQGAMAGGTQVSVRGSGFEGGVVYFGPTAADQWSCSDTLCTATAPTSVTAQTVDVQVVTPGGSSPATDADRFTFIDSPPPPPAPVVTGVSPSTGNDLGGDTVTIQGSGFTGVTDVEFGAGEPADDFQVVDDSTISATTPQTYQPGTADVVVTGPGGTSAASPADQFTFDDAPPTITSISPSSGPDLGGTPFTITGTHLGNGDATSIEIGYTSVEDVSCSETTCTGTTPPGTDGPADVSVYNENVYANGVDTPTLSGGFTYTQGPAPTITKVVPDTGVVAGGTQVVISGSNLQTGEVKFGTTYAEATCTSTVCVATSPPAPKAETVNVSVSTVAGTSATTPADEFGYVHTTKPAVTGLTPDTGYVGAGTTVQVTGTHLTDGTVAFGGTHAYGECTDTRCTVDAPESSVPGPVHVTVATSEGTSDQTPADEFTYLEPVVTSISPDHGWTQGGTDVTITGTDLGGSPEDPAEDETIMFGDQSTSGTCTGTQCTVSSPAVSNATTSVHVRVLPDGGGESAATSSDLFTYSVRPAPTVTGVSPSTGADVGGDTVTVTGTALKGSSVYFGGNYAGNDCDNTSCTVVAPRAPSGTDGPVDVFVRNNWAGQSDTSSADVYTYVPPAAPTVSGISPDHGTIDGGTTVTLDGSALYGAAITFAGTPAKNVTCTPTQCTATTPAHATAEAVDVAVTTHGLSSGGGSATTSYSYEIPPVPTVTGVTPASGPRSGGTPVTVTGTDLGGGSVTVGGTPATSVSCTATICRAIVPAGAAGDADVTVTTSGGTSAAVPADRFTYRPVRIQEHDIPGVGSGTGGGGIVRGPNGDMWFALTNQSLIGRLSAADGTITTYPTPTANAKPTGITEGPDGRMWVAERGADALVAIDGSGTETSYPVPGQPDDLRFLTAGPDGRIWFTFAGSGAIGALDPADGGLSVYHLPDPTVFPYNIVPGPDGRLWFTEVYGSSIGAITTDGDITEYPLPNSGTEAWGLTVGPDNRLWFAETVQRDLGAITTSGKVTIYPVPGELDDPQGVLAGPDGRVWFTAPDVDQVNALDPATGDVSEYALPPGYQAGEAPRYLAMDTSGTLWLTENQGPHLLSVDGITSAVAPTVTGVAADHGAAGDTVTITGGNLTGASAVEFGGTPAAAYTVDDPAHITATVPAGSGIVHVTVTTADGTSATTSADRFSYGAAIVPAPTVTGVAPDSGPVAGGTVVTVTGSDLSGASVAFGGVAATDVSCTVSSCTATSPPGSAGPVHVTATTSGGTSATGDADRFVYLAPEPPAPTVTGVSPATGTDAGGDAVTVTGTDLSGATIAFGLAQAADVTCSDTSCTVVTPANGAGPVDVRVTTDGGTSARTDADRFTYVAAAKVPTTTALTLSGTGISTDGSSYSAPTGVDYVNLTAHTTEYGDGTVTFYDGATSLGSVPAYSGYASSYESLPADGTHDFRAVFVPVDDDYYAGSEGDATLVVGGSPPSTKDATALTISAPSRVRYGSALTVSTKVKDTTSGQALGGVTATLYRRASSGASWTKVTGATTSSTGLASAKLRPKADLQLQWRFAGNGGHQAATSSTRSVSVAQVVVLATTKTKVRHGKTFSLFGYVKPAGSGQKVSLQMKVGSKWKTVKSVTLKKRRLPNGSTRVGYVFPRTLSHKGSYSFRVVKAATRTLAKGVSKVVTVKVT